MNTNLKKQRILIPVILIAALLLVAGPAAARANVQASLPLYLSLTGNQTVGGVAAADEDILRFDGQNWSLFFDGSDVGVGSLDLFAFSIVDADTILVSFNNAITINGLTVNPQDVVRFDATSLGSVTVGAFSMYLDGSDVGLDTTAEKIDSVSLLPDGRVLISTTGNPAVVGITGGRDEDVLAFTPTTLGDVTSGTWAMYFDGSDVGLAETSGEDIDALDVTPNGNIYLSTLGDFSVNGISGFDEDVLVCAPTSLGNVTACNYSSNLYFDGSTWGLASNDVDAFNFLSTTNGNCTPLVFGQTIAGAIDPATEVDCFTFEGAVNDQIRVRVVETSGTLVAEQEMVRPIGTTLCGPTTAVEQTCLLDATGSHIILIRDTTIGTRTGGYSLYLQRLNNPVGCTPLGFGQTLAGSIDLPAETDCFTFEGAVNDQVRVRVIKISGTLVPYYEIVRPNGTTRCGPTIASELTCLIDVAGTHTILVRDATVGTRTGSYQVSLE